MGLKKLLQRTRYHSWNFKASTPAEVAEFYDQYNRVIAQFYGGNMHYGYWDGPDDDSSIEVAAARLTEIMIDKLRIKPGDRVLDLGCGPGKPAVQMAKTTGAQVVGVSISSKDVELAGFRAEALNLQDQLSFQVADANDLPFEPDSFDAVLALESIVHMEDRAHVLRQIARVLKPGGRVALTDFIQRGPISDDEDEQRALVEMLKAWRAAPLVEIEDYVEFAQHAGLILDETIDITQQTKYTFPYTYAAMRDQLERGAKLPPELAAILADTTAEDWKIDESVDPAEGVVIVVAHKPDQRR
ncbi:methyltransferase domain-containing protein [Actinoplanes sp. NEAU-A12]|uniref:Methyltransferase domain-containing protein n=1 Tax=Actinoplanes sandaracinus TaxID=3045177 RepID=A0ABT6WZZ4_9ACTN|nr:methyltransferase domain-containing protein [Actinoplanes sandaracinus]MDI6105171.1 methyltransferase domain-containing protein [Actinoplanes sandaracinus]